MTITRFILALSLLIIGVTKTFAQVIVGPRMWETDGVGEFREVITAADTTAVLAGWYLSDSGTSLLIEIDRTGEESDRQGFSNARHFVMTTFLDDGNGGHLLIGFSSDQRYSTRPIVVIRADSTGEAIWMETYRDRNHERTPYTAVRLSDGNVLLASYARDRNVLRSRLHLLCLNVDGEIVWQSTPDSAQSDLVVQEIVEGENGTLRFLLKYYVHSVGSLTVIPMIITTDSVGNHLSSTFFGNPNSDTTISLSSLIPTEDGGYLAGGTIYHGVEGQNGNFAFPDIATADYHLLKLDDSLAVEWSRSVDFNGNGDRGFGMILLDDDVVLLAGTTDIVNEATYSGTIGLATIDLEGNVRRVWQSDATCAIVNGLGMMADSTLLLYGSYGCVSGERDMSIWRVWSSEELLDVQPSPFMIRALDLTQAE